MASKVKLLVEGFVDNSYNIFDLYIQLYTLLKKYQSTALRKAEEEIDLYNDCINELKCMFEKRDFKIKIIEKNKRDILDAIYNYEENIFVLLVALFYCIDEIFGEQRYRQSKEEYDLVEKVEEISSLNSDKTYDLGKVFYKSYSLLEELYSGDLFRPQDSIGCSINREQHNLLIYCEPENDYQICLSRIKHSYVNDILTKGENSIGIALVPFTGASNYLEFIEEGDKFFLNKLNNEEQYKQKVLEILEKLKFQNINIVVFPEMVFSEDILTSVKKYLNQNKGFFTLIISGTIWKDRINKCVVISGDGIELIRQKKLNRYEKTIDINAKGNNEGIYISSENKIINIFDVLNIGRLGVSICVDFITEDYYIELEKMGTNMSFVPAYTSSLAVFKNNANRLSGANLGSTFLCNCCIPMVNDENGKSKSSSSEVSFSFVPLKKKKYGNDIMMSCKPDSRICDCYNDKHCCFLVFFKEKYCKFKKVEL